MEVILLSILVLWLLGEILTVRVWVIYDLMPPKRGRRPGYVYAFRGARENPRHVKLGRTNDLERRIREHSTANPYGVKLLGARYVPCCYTAEKNIHNRWKKQQINREWYRMGIRMWLYVRML